MTLWHKKCIYPPLARATTSPGGEYIFGRNQQAMAGQSERPTEKEAGNAGAAAVQRRGKMQGLSRKGGKTKMPSKKVEGSPERSSVPFAQFPEYILKHIGSFFYQDVVSFSAMARCSKWFKKSVGDYGAIADPFVVSPFLRRLVCRLNKNCLSVYAA